MNTDTWHALQVKFAQFPILRADGASFGEIDAAAQEIGKSFPADYREFLHRYGSAIIGPYPIFGLRPVEPMGNVWSVVDVNSEKTSRWPGTEEWLIISEDLGGNPIGIANDGAVWMADFELGDGEIIPLADNFEGFLRKECLKI